MGGGRWSDDTWATYSSTKVAGKTTDAIYSRRTIKKEFNPVDVTIRESRDSEDNPESNAIIVALDVTGSMTRVLDSMARKGLPTLAKEIYDRKPVNDPHLMCMGIGDVEMGDKYPLQVTQFEADIRIAEQLSDLYLERGGGGNGYESYNLAWYFAGMYTSIDCFEKRGKKGYLFTVGDEYPPEGLRAEFLQKCFKNAPNTDLSMEAMLSVAQRMYNVYHVIVEDSGTVGRSDVTFHKWVSVLGENVIRLSDHTMLAEVIVSTIQMNEGLSKEDIIASWDGSTALVVDKALSVKSVTSSTTKAGVVTLS
jgi:hypothetical protein